MFFLPMIFKTNLLHVQSANELKKKKRKKENLPRFEPRSPGRSDPMGKF